MMNGGVYNMRVQKLAFDKERFELLLYGFFSKQETDIIISMSGGREAAIRGLDEVGGGSPKGSPSSDLILTSNCSLTSSRHGDNDICFFFLEKSPYNNS